MVQKKKQELENSKKEQVDFDKNVVLQKHNRVLTLSKYYLFT